MQDLQSRIGKMPNNNDTMIVLILGTIVVLYFSCYIGV